MDINFKSSETWKVIGGIVCFILFLTYLFSPSCSNSFYTGDVDNTYNCIPYNDAPAQNTVPSWVYGTWTCTTPYGTETIKIEENGGIWNITNGYADYGSFTYSNGVIRANFPKDGGLVTSMPLDMDNRRIEYGGGYYWRKTR